MSFHRFFRKESTRHRSHRLAGKRATKYQCNHHQLKLWMINVIHSPWSLQNGLPLKKSGWKTSFFPSGDSYLSSTELLNFGVERIPWFSKCHLKLDWNFRRRSNVLLVFVVPLERRYDGMISREFSGQHPLWPMQWQHMTHRKTWRNQPVLIRHTRHKTVGDRTAPLATTGRCKCFFLCLRLASGPLGNVAKYTVHGSYGKST